MGQELGGGCLDHFNCTLTLKRLQMKYLVQVKNNAVNLKRILILQHVLLIIFIHLCFRIKIEAFEGRIQRM